MKYILTASLLLVFGHCLYGQCPTTYAGNLGQIRYNKGVSAFDQVIIGDTAQFPACASKIGAIAYHGGFFFYNTGSQWVTPAAAGSGITLLNTTYPLTGGPVTTTGAIAIPKATTHIAGYLDSVDWQTFNGKQTALGFTPENAANKATSFSTLNNTLYPTTSAVNTLVNTGLALKLNLTDTASMLTNYLRSASAALLYYPLNSNPAGYLTTADITGKVNYTDTSAMLNPYQRKGDSATYYPIYRSDTSRTNIYSAIAGKQASGNYITALSGDVVATGPGSASSTIQTGAVTSAKILDGTILNIDINASAAIAYTKLNLNSSIVNADIATGAAIAYSKLNLTGSLVIADLSATGTPGATTYLRGDNTWAVPSGTGVSAVSIATANGFSGSSSGGSNPALTIVAGAIVPTSVNGVTISGSSAPTLAVTGATAVSGTNTGDQTSVTGNAGTATVLQTPRAIYGNNFDGSAALNQIIASTYGGTGNGFTKFTGPATSEKTFTLPNASATILTDNAVVTVAQGGTGSATLTAHNMLIGNGTSAITSLAPGATSGKVPYSNGTDFVMSTPTLPLSSAATSGNYPRGDGTNWVSNTIQAADIPDISATYVTWSANNNQTGTTYTLVASDRGKIVSFSNSSAITLTVPSGLGATFYCTIQQNGTGAITPTASSTTLHIAHSYTKSNGQYTMFSIMFTNTTDTYDLQGDML